MNRTLRALVGLGCAVLLAAASAAAGCGDDESPAEGKQGGATTTESKQANPDPAADPTGKTLDASSQPPDARIKVAMKDVAFTPEYLTARTGQTLVFTNEDDVEHKVEGDEGQIFASKTLKKGDTFEVKLDQGADEPNLAFKCPIHPVKMQGGIVVAK